MRRARKIFIAMLLGCGVCSARLEAEDYPLLEQLNRETQSLYRDVQGGLVRIQLPTPRWIKEAAVQDDPLQAWDELDATVKTSIDGMRRRSVEQGQVPRIEAVVVPAGQEQAAQRSQRRPTTRPATRPAQALPGQLDDNWTVRQGANQEMILESRSAGGSALVLHAGTRGEAGQGNAIGGALRLTTQPAVDGFAPNNLGLLLDDAGHVLVPICVEKETFGGQAVRVRVGGRDSAATFVGCDDKTNITIVKLQEQIGKPVRMGVGRPNEGTLVMMLNPSSGSGRLMLWTGGQREYGVVVGMDGAVAGFTRFGQFLGGPAIGNVIEQIIQRGEVQRPVWGVRLTEIRTDDPRRQGQLGDRPALHVDEVAADSPAQRGLLQKGDLILQMDDHPIGDLPTWAALSARTGAVRLLILREGREHNLTVQLKAE